MYRTPCCLFFVKRLTNYDVLKNSRLTLIQENTLSVCTLILIKNICNIQYFAQQNWTSSFLDSRKKTWTVCTSNVSGIAKATKLLLSILILSHCNSSCHSHFSFSFPRPQHLFIEVQNKFVNNSSFFDKSCHKHSDWTFEVWIFKSCICLNICI